MNLGINQGVIVEFQLSSSQYATVAMREFMQCAPRNAPGSKKEAICKAMLADGKGGTAKPIVYVFWSPVNFSMRRFRNSRCVISMYMYNI